MTIRPLPPSRRMLFIIIATGITLLIAGIALAMLEPILLALLAPAVAIGALIAFQQIKSAKAIRRIEKRLDQAEIGEHLTLLHTINNRTRRNSPTINNIAGSVGRMAPIVRSISGDTKALRSLPTATASQAEKQSPKQKAAGTPNLQDSMPAGVFPPAVQPQRPPTFEDIRVAIIADEFTEVAFAYEWNTLALTPTNWKTEIEDFDPHILFVESAWEANGGLWRYHLVGASAPRPAVRELINYCKAKSIPTAFWNKEDPPHFEDFLPTAELFDTVFTTEGDLIPEYKRRLQHSQVFLLPFAAQPMVHNPARIGRSNRDLEIVFGGMYFKHKYPERREQMAMLLPAASKFDLDIYSRQAGGNPDYQFPEPFGSFVRGSLPYEQMLSAYRRYKVVLNVNSVVGSPTMCARRIFEATASGAAVVTAPSPAISKYFPNEMLTTADSENEAYHKIRSLLRSDEYRERKVHLAQRHVWETATYTDRATSVMEAVGVAHSRQVPTKSFVISTNRPSNLTLLLENVARQEVADKQLVLVTHGFDLSDNQKRHIGRNYSFDDVVIETASSSKTLGENLNRLFELADGDMIFRMDDDDYYGANYARDLAHALHYSNADLVGKAESYIYFEEVNSTVLSYQGHSNRETDFIRGATFCGRRDVFDAVKFPESRTSEDSGFLSRLKAAGGKTYAADRFNFLVMRRANKSQHTWRISDSALFGSGEMKFIGCDPEQVSL